MSKDKDKKKDTDLNTEETSEETVEETVDEATPKRARRVDPRAVAAMGEPAGALRIAAMPAFGLGIAAVLTGIIWAMSTKHFLTLAPLSWVGGGVVAIAFGVWFGLRPMAAQLHGRGWLVVLVSLGLVAAVLLLLVGVNVGGLVFHTRIDMTKDRYLGLSDGSRGVLKKVDSDVNIALVISTNPWERPSYDRGNLRRLMSEYQAACRKISWEEVDLFENPGRQEDLGVSFPGKAVVTSGERREEVTLGPDNEEGLTTAIYRVTKPDKTAIYALTGHGEVSLEQFGGQDGVQASNLRKALDNVQMEVKDLSLAKTDPDMGTVHIDNAGVDAALNDVPEDAGAVLILGPRTPLMQSEIDALQRYLDRKDGGLFVALAFEEGAPDLHELLNQYGVSVEPGLVIDPSDYLYGPEYPQASPEGDNEVVDSIIAVVMPMAKALNVESAQEPNPYGGPPPQSDATPLLQSGRYAWAETRPLNEVRTAGAPGGPYSLAVAIDTGGAPPPMPGMMQPEQVDEPGVRMVVVGSYLAFDDSLTQRLNKGTNIDFATRSVGWLARTGSVSIPPKKPSTFQVSFSPAANKVVGVLLLLVIPLGTLLAGAIIWWVRR